MSPPGIAEFFRDAALALADIVTPNRFELEYLTGRSVATPRRGGGGGRGVARGRPGDRAGHQHRGRAATASRCWRRGRTGAWAVETPRLPVMLNGCGDVTAALFLGRLLRGEALPDALALTAASMYAVIETTMRLGRYELALVAAQEELAVASRGFQR